MKIHSCAFRFGPKSFGFSSSMFFVVNKILSISVARGEGGGRAQVGGWGGGKKYLHVVVISQKAKEKGRRSSSGRSQSEGATRTEAGSG